MNQDSVMGGAAASLLAQGLRRTRAERKGFARLQRQARSEPLLASSAEEHAGFASRRSSQNHTHSIQSALATEAHGRAVSIWKTLRKCSYLVDGLRRAGFRGGS